MKKIILEIGSKILQEFRKLDTSVDESDYHEIYSPESIEQRRFYNIGAGSFSHPCWTNVDGDSKYYEELYKSTYTGIIHDLFDQTPMPVENNVAEIIFTSHTIEHIDNASAAYLFKDCYRMLRKGGVFRIVTPDIDLHYQAWRNNDRKFFFWIDEEYVNVDFEKQYLNMPLSEASLSQIFLEEFAAGASEIALVGAEKRISDQELKELFDTKTY
jgi:predicted SAM-dependent methyltransferase